MRDRFRTATITTAAIIAILSLASVRTSGQVAKYTGPRTADGKPQLSGVWQALNTATWDIQAHSAQPELHIPAGRSVVERDEIPYQSWAAAKKKENAANRITADPETQCYLPGVPRATYMPFPFEIAQAPKAVVIRYEYARAIRTIPTDGSKHPDGTLNLWMGDSRGHWEGDTLVVDVRGFTDQTWFDRAGNFHSDALHVVERYTPNGLNHLLYEVTIEDPKVFTRPWKMSMPLYRLMERNPEVLEYECVEFAQEREFGKSK